MADAPAHVGPLVNGNQFSQAWRDFFREVGTDASEVGDYLATARTDVGSGWLLCDGSAVSNTDYPSLYKLIGGITGSGGTAGTFKLPGIAGVYDPSSPAPGGTPVLQWWIKAR